MSDATQGVISCFNDQFQVEHNETASDLDFRTQDIKFETGTKIIEITTTNIRPMSRHTHTYQNKKVD